MFELNVTLLSWVMLSLIWTVGGIVAAFSYRYLANEPYFKRFYASLTAILLSASILVTTDNLLIFLLSWLSTSFILTRLMAPLPNWHEGRASSLKALVIFLSGSVSLAVSFCLFYAITGTTSISTLLNSHPTNGLSLLASLFLVLAACMQTAIWPFHRWLLSSLNSPTPVSALMHAGIINAGGFLLIKFSPLFFDNTVLLQLLFVLGVTTAILGTLYKLISCDIKRMLACSTMAQMGYMVAQIGLGLYSVAIVHLFCHGLFKAHLFLKAANAVEDKFLKLPALTFSRVLILTINSLLAGFIFSYMIDISFFVADTRLFLFVLVMIFTFALLVPLCADLSIKNQAIMSIIAISMGSFYGVFVKMADLLVGQAITIQPQLLNPVYWSGLIALVTAWLIVILHKTSMLQRCFGAFFDRFYVCLLNASQPAASTVTASRYLFWR